jgi:hypothetical protein
MGLKAAAARIFARRIVRKDKKWMESAVDAQDQTLKSLIHAGRGTAFGRDHHFENISDHTSLIQNIPLSGYEELRPYIDRILNGEKDVLWPGTPLYLAKTSGTTSGTKYIPLTRESMPNHIRAARNALLHYLSKSGNADFTEGKMIFLQGSPELTQKNGLKIGRLSGIVAHYVPAYLQSNRLPSWETNCIEDWETKVECVIDETIEEDMRLISGIPSWLLMYFERVHQRTGKTMLEVWPNFSLMVIGGVSFEPYRKKFETLIGGRVDIVETYPASEGFIAFQDIPDSNELLLLADNGIYYEFIPAESYFDSNPPRLSLAEVEVGVNYALIMHTNSGLWGYNIGDTVQFTSLHPYRLIVSGRIKHFTSAFGEHVIASEVEYAMKKALEADQQAKVIEFHVAPQVNPSEGLPYHEWYVEFDTSPEDMKRFIHALDEHLQQKNIYYKDLISGKVLRPLEVRKVRRGGFRDYMAGIGKLGGQNKVPRLSNDRSVVDRLKEFRQD